MQIDCGKTGLIDILNARLKMWGFNEDGSAISDNAIFEEALCRTQKSFSYSRNKRFCTEDGIVKYSIHHSVQTSILLYYLSNVAFKHGDFVLADSIYYLNKIMHSVDWFYEIELPEVFGAEHPVGSVLGRATYGNRLFVHQNTTIGSSIDKFPVVGDNVVLCANSSVFGDCHIGSNCIISAGATVINTDVPNNSIIFQDGSIHVMPEQKIKSRIAILTDFFE